MKSLEELKAIRERMQSQLNVRDESGDKTRVVVGMATCGIAAGARPVLNRFAELVQERGLKDVTVTQAGCIGICKYEPVVEIFDKDGKKTTYVNMTPDKAEEVVTRHLTGGTVVKDYVIPAKISAPGADA
ncbi:MAG: (2Fe-2S) ferredoxin domain-containing protein [Eubacterium sp.]|nr:(2Fe-2S) ferredoxin domain-containing protein [Eubacterium sp.]